MKNKEIYIKGSLYSTFGIYKNRLMITINRRRFFKSDILYHYDLNDFERPESNMEKWRNRVLKEALEKYENNI